MLSPYLGKRLLITIMITHVFALTICSQNYKHKIDSIDSLLSKQFPEDQPGAVFLISEKGKIQYQKAFGMANLEYDVPMSTEQVFEIGSMTKQFTAIAIMILKEQGELHLDDDIRNYIPDYPTHGNKITIHHLLTHTSGIKNHTSIKEIGNIAKKDLNPLELIDFFKDAPMDFKPGEKFKYSNSGYVILGYIIEKVSGKSYAKFIQEHIFDVLDMKSSRYASRQTVIKNRAAGYHFKKNEYINRREISYHIPYASGSLMSTVHDLMKWQEAIKNGKLINEENTKLVFTNHTLTNGTPIHYGYGWHIKSINEMLSREHGGHIFGYKSMGVYLPEKDIYVLGLTNCDCNSPTQITRDIAKIVAN